MLKLCLIVAGVAATGQVIEGFKTDDGDQISKE
jgi:hypothetical protein